MLSAEDILCNTQQVISGLEALRGENRSLLESLQPPEESLSASESNSVDQEKCGIIRQSLDRIELGLSEAQVLKRHFIDGRIVSFSIFVSLTVV